MTLTLHAAPAGYSPGTTYNPENVRIHRGYVLGSLAVHLVENREPQPGGRPTITRTLCGRDGVSVAAGYDASAWPTVVGYIARKLEGAACTRCAARAAATWDAAGIPPLVEHGPAAPALRVVESLTWPGTFDVVTDAGHIYRCGRLEGWTTRAAAAGYAARRLVELGGVGEAAQVAAVLADAWVTFSRCVTTGPGEVLVFSRSAAYAEEALTRAGWIVDRAGDSLDVRRAADVEQPAAA